VEKARPITITVASIAFIIFGLVTIVFAVLFGIALFSLATNLSDVGAFVVGGLIFLIAVLGILDTVAGYGLWHVKRWAAIMGMLLGVVGLIFQNFFYYLILGVTNYATYSPSVIYAGAGSPWVDILLVLLIAISWKSFEPSST
jgi:hypothetical protein